jgi:hypothetical protein
VVGEPAVVKRADETERGGHLAEATDGV